MDGKLRYCPFTGAEAAQPWMHAKTYIERMLQYDDGTLSLQKVWEAIIAQRMQLWIVAEDEDITGALLTEFADYGYGLEMKIVGAASDKFNLWLDELPAIEAYAMSLGVRRLRCAGRPGWERVLKKQGFVKRAVVLTKELGVLH